MQLTQLNEQTCSLLHRCTRRTYDLDTLKTQTGTFSHIVAGHGEIYSSGEPLNVAQR